jgi:hypothetical protein
MKLRNRRETPESTRARENLWPPENPDAQVGERARWIVDPETGRPLPPRAQPGYYPGFSTLDQQAFWDEATRRVVLDRVHHVPPIRFFSPEEVRLMEAVCARLLPQDDRDAAHQIPLVPGVDERLASGRIDGYRFEDMPPDGDAYHLGLRGIQAIAEAMCGAPFEQLGSLDQDRVLKTLHDDAPPAGGEIWQRLPPRRFWMLLLQDVIEVYYSHPWAWDEIGFGGPAYPRGYMRLEHGQPEPWEKQERRYEWAPPPESLSGEYTPLGGPGGHKSQTPGQEGTH